MNNIDFICVSMFRTPGMPARWYLRELAIWKGIFEERDQANKGSMNALIFSRRDRKWRDFLFEDRAPATIPYHTAQAQSPTDKFTNFWNPAGRKRSRRGQFYLLPAGEERARRVAQKMGFVL
jgi:hypothetical protein